MNSLALYRKYRSQTFEDLVGQDHVVRSLTSAIERGRIAHAYLFTGPRGTGKTSAARLLAKALNCTGGPSIKIPDDCPICAEIASGSCLDVVEMDAASESKVEDVREKIVEFCEYQPSSCRYKVFIIDEVHDLSSKAFDALLKTIEEPPAHVIFVLATTEFNKVPPTVRSRCQRFEFHRGSVQDLTSRLQHVADAEGVKAEATALRAIARMADGGYRDALTLLEQAILVGDGEVTLQIVYDQLGLVKDEEIDDLLLNIVSGDIPKILNKVEGIYRHGRDPRVLLESLMYRLADLTRSVYEIDLGGSGDAALEAGLSAAASRIGKEKLMLIRSGIAEAHKEIRDITLPKLWLEAELIRLSQSLTAPKAVAVVSERPAREPEPSTPRPAAHRDAQPAKPVTTSATAVTPVASAPSVKPMGPWATIVASLSAVSRTAAARLAQSTVASESDNAVVIEFKKVVDADWVKDHLKIQQAIAEQWKSITGNTATFQYIASGKAPPPTSVSQTSVELPLEGERLAQAVQEIFEAPIGDNPKPEDLNGEDRTDADDEDTQKK